MNIPWQKWHRARPRHVAALARNGFRSRLDACFKARAPGRIRRHFPESDFVGPYEKSGEYIGMWEEQWLWARRDLIRGAVLDMSTPRALHEFIHHLPGVDKVVISDLSDREISKNCPPSKVDIVGDFCAVPPPAPPDSFDTILCISILEHCEDPRAMLRNFRTVLRPKGVAFIWCPFAYIDGHLGDKGPDNWRFGRDGFRLLARQADLEVVDLGQYDDLGPFFRFKFGWSAAATSWHRGVPIFNWMIARRPG